MTKHHLCSCPYIVNNLRLITYKFMELLVFPNTMCCIMHLALIFYLILSHWNIILVLIYSHQNGHVCTRKSLPLTDALSADLFISCQIKFNIVKHFYHKATIIYEIHRRLSMHCWVLPNFILMTAVVCCNGKITCTQVDTCIQNCQLVLIIYNIINQAWLASYSKA